METSGKEEPKYQVKGDKTQNAAGEAAAATPQGDKPKAKRVRTKKPKADAEATPAAEAGTDASKTDANGEVKEKKPRQKRERKPKEDAERSNTAEAKNGKYRVKGEKDDEKLEAAEGDANASNKKDGEAPKKKRTKKTKEDGAEQANGDTEAKYRVKGEKGEETVDQPKKGKVDDKKKRDQPEKQKNLVYRNPMDFKEKKKFKSKWEEYHYGEWKRGSGKTFVTLETVIPAAPEKAIATPDETNYRKKKQDIDDAISGINKGLDDKKTQFEGILSQKQAARGAGQQAAAAEEKEGEPVEAAPKSQSLKELFNRMGELQKQKKAIYAVQDTIGATNAKL